jgi:hypothetical protein
VVQFCCIVNFLLKIFNNCLRGTRFATLFWGNYSGQDIKRALEFASVCDHPNAVWLTKLVGGHDVDSQEEARQVFLVYENDSRALCFAGFLGGTLMRYVKLLFLAMRDDGREN